MFFQVFVGRRNFLKVILCPQWKVTLYKANKRKNIRKLLKIGNRLQSYSEISLQYIEVLIQWPVLASLFSTIELTTPIVLIVCIQVQKYLEFQSKSVSYPKIGPWIQKQYIVKRYLKNFVKTCIIKTLVQWFLSVLSNSH